MTLEEAAANIGRGVVYRPRPGDGHDWMEEGEITSVNNKWVFVRYGTLGTPRATRPEDLDFTGGS